MATTQETIDYYANLLIKQYLGKPKAYANIQTVVQPKLMPQGQNIIVDNEGNPIYDNLGDWVVDGPFIEPILPLAVQQAFDLDTAEGVQLNSIGKYIGADRTGCTFTTTQTLDDDQYRQFLKIKSALNSLRADSQSVQGFLEEFFSGTLILFDYLHMRIGYFYTAQIGSNTIAEMFITSGFLPRPLGVRMDPVINASPVNNFFGFRTYNSPSPSFVAPFNTYTSYLYGTPFLLYTNGVNVSCGRFSPLTPINNLFGMGTYLIPAYPFVTPFNTYAFYSLNSPWVVY